MAITSDPLLMRSITKYLGRQYEIEEMSGIGKMARIERAQPMNLMTPQHRFVRA
jgi:hypothetical protein